MRRNFFSYSFVVALRKEMERKNKKMKKSSRSGSISRFCAGRLAASGSGGSSRGALSTVTRGTPISYIEKYMNGFSNDGKKVMLKYMHT